MDTQCVDETGVALQGPLVLIWSFHGVIYTTQTSRMRRIAVTSVQLIGSETSQFCYYQNISSAFSRNRVTVCRSLATRYIHNTAYHRTLSSGSLHETQLTRDRSMHSPFTTARWTFCVYEKCYYYYYYRQQQGLLLVQSRASSLVAHVSLLS